MASTYQESVTTKATADLSPKRSKLYVVATPIGNLGDFSPRAREVLARADAICAEDTRVFRHLCTAAGLTTRRRVISLHAHNEAEKIAEVIGLLQENQSVALVSDAGTPGLSDPGQRLVYEAGQQGIEVVAVPGPSALTAALSIGGLRPEDDEPMMFWGFLPSRSRQRQEQLARIAQRPGLSVFFESPHRILDCLEDAAKAFGHDAQVVVARELTKRFEACLRGPLIGVLETLRAQEKQAEAPGFKGEFVLLVKNVQQSQGRDEGPHEGCGAENLEAHQIVWLKSLCRHCPKPLAAKIVAEVLGIRRDEAYRLVLETEL